MTCRLRWLKTKKVPECIVTWFLSSFQGNQRLSGGWQLSGRVATAEGSLRSYSKVVKFSCLMLWIVSLSSLWLIRIPVYTTYPPPVVFLFEKKEDDESSTVPTTNFTEVSTDVVGSEERDIENWRLFSRRLVVGASQWQNCPVKWVSAWSTWKLAWR